jgi:hypothetical protein
VRFKDLAFWAVYGLYLIFLVATMLVQPIRRGTHGSRFSDYVRDSTITALRAQLAARDSGVQRVEVQRTTAMWFNHVQGAWGRLYPESEDYCAAWGFPKGTLLELRRPHDRTCQWSQKLGKYIWLDSSRVKVCTVSVQDRGPDYAALRRGVTLDLSPHAFRKLAPLSAGLIDVTWRVLAPKDDTAPNGKPLEGLR